MADPEWLTTTLICGGVPAAPAGAATSADDRAVTTAVPARTHRWRRPDFASAPFGDVPVLSSSLGTTKFLLIDSAIDVTG